jgi:hypothetical protein
MAAISRVSAIGATAQTGQRWPERGVWVVVEPNPVSALIPAGRMMPHYRGKIVTWRLVSYGR